MYAITLVQSKGRLLVSRKFIVILLAAVFVFGAVFTPAAPAEAGTNGQQLRIDVSCSYAPALAEIKVSGTNQRNQRVTWSAKPNARGVVTYNYWWVGTVRIEYRYSGINPATGSPFGWYSTSAYVPKNFNRDIFPVAVDQGLDCQPW